MSFQQLYDNPRIRGIEADVDAIQLNRMISNAEERAIPETATAELRIAACSASAMFFKENPLQSILLESYDPGRASQATDKWLAYFGAIKLCDEQCNSTELLLFAAVGLLAQRPVEVRATVRQNMTVSHSCVWVDTVREDISQALLLLITQQDHEEIKAVKEVLSSLTIKQKQLENEWLQTASRSSTLAALGLYHVAHAALRTGEYLAVGSVLQNRKIVTDFLPELRRLLSKGEEYIEASNDPELLLWLESAAAVLANIRANSIWANARGTSEKIDNFLEQLADEARSKPIFSLLPSQQDALRKNLLDPTKVAVVLQMPTSAGKTLLAELSIIQVCEAYRNTKVRVAYVCPTRALTTQVRRTLAEDLRPLGITVSAAGSAFEEDPYELNLLQEQEGVVVLTPEKLDLLIRINNEWASTLRLVVVDEAHLLADAGRGVRLELLLAKIRREHPHAKLLLLTPFVNNAEEIAKWLGGSSRGVEISVRWRPSRLFLGLAKVHGRASNRRLTISWREPHLSTYGPKDTDIPTSMSSTNAAAASNVLLLLRREMQSLGTILGMFAASKKSAEQAAFKVAEESEPIDDPGATLRVALAIAKNEFGPDSDLAYCLERGVAYHHSSLSPLLRFLVEDLVRTRCVNFISATTTLAQGMNFPVAVVLVHSIHKPFGRGDLSPSEFWNIAGRAARLGSCEKGLIVFTNKNHEEKWKKYSEALSSSIFSALIRVLESGYASNLKVSYRDHEELRPFFQYLAHAAANKGIPGAFAELEELLGASLANVQSQSSGANHKRKLQLLAKSYLKELQRTKRNPGYLKAADAAGLGSFSFDSLYAALNNNPVLKVGPQEILQSGAKGYQSFVSALKFIPEFDIGLGKGQGHLGEESIAAVINHWVSGQSIVTIAEEFPGDTDADRIRAAGNYVYSKVSQVISWAAHAYIRGWMLGKDDDAGTAEGRMLPAYIQYGVNSPEGAVASLLGMPRQFAEPAGKVFRDKHGPLKPETTSLFREYLEKGDTSFWEAVVERSALHGRLEPGDMQSVWRKIRGIA